MMLAPVFWETITCELPICFEGSINPLRLSKSLNLIPYSALSINRILATSAFGFLVLSKPPFYPLLEMATFSPVMRPNDRELTSSLIQTVNWNYVLNRANE